ncbi:hypothetical protein ACTQ76_001145 [Vibrio alginolyticus]
MVQMDEFIWKRYMEDIEGMFRDAVTSLDLQHRAVMAKAITAMLIQEPPFKLTDENIIYYLKSPDDIKRQIFVQYGYFDPRLESSLQEAVLCIDNIKEPLLNSIKNAR